LNNFIGISIIICCHNSASKLPPTLTALSRQKVIGKIACEIILVDNNSSDDTGAVATNIWKKLGEPFSLMIVEEKIPGLSNARSKGILASQYEYLIFCDDDNWLFDDYLNTVYGLFDSKPEVALIGGVGHAELDVKAPEWFQTLAGFGYAIGSDGRQTGYTDSAYGAGMAIRKEMLQALNDGHISFILSDRVGKNLSSGGDSEMSVLVNASGKKIWFDEGLKFGHKLPSWRINWSYYRRLRYAFGCANVFLELYNEAFKIPGKKVALKDLIYYCIRYSHLIMLGYFFKKEKYAYAMQQLGKFATLYFDNDKLKEKLPIAISNKRYLTAIAS